MDAYALRRLLGAAESRPRAGAAAASESGSRGCLLPVRRAELQSHLRARGSTEVCLFGEACSMTTRKQKESVWACPLQWPAGWPRAKSRSNSPFKMDANKSRRKLLDEIAMMGGKLPIISTNARIRVDGEPRGDDTPNDSGVAVYFERKGKRM